MHVPPDPGDHSVSSALHCAGQLGCLAFNTCREGWLEKSLEILDVFAKHHLKLTLNLLILFILSFDSAEKISGVGGVGQVDKTSDVES